MSRRSILCLALWLTLRPASLPAGEPVAFVDRYGDPLPSGAIARLGTIRLRHAGTAEAIAYSPDGRLLAIGGDECLVRVWEARSGRPVQVLRGHRGSITSLAFSPDGAVLASAGGGDGTVRLWQVRTGRMLRSWTAHNDYVLCVAFASDGEALATGGSNDERVRLWNAETGQEIRSFRGGMAHIWSLAFAPDGKTLAAGYESIDLWNVATGAKVRTLSPDRIGCIESLVFAPDGKSLAASGVSPTIRLLDVVSGKSLHTFEIKFSQMVAFAPDGKTLAGAGQREIALWDTVSGKKRSSISTNFAKGVAFSPDGRTLANTYGNHGPSQVRLWDVSTGEEVCPLPGHRGAVQRLAWSADGKKLATVDDSEEICLWDAVSGRRLGTVPGKHERLGDIALNLEGEKFLPAKSLNGRLEARADDNGTIHLMDTKAGAEVTCFSGNQGRIRSLAFAADGRTLASAGEDGTVLLWDVNGSRRPAPLVLSDKELQALWDALANSDARTAQDAIWRLAAVPERAVPFLAERVRPVPLLSTDRIHHLITELDDDHFAVRERATRELAALGRRAEPALRQTLKHRPSLEVRRRVEALLPQLRRLSPKEWQEVRSVRVLDQANTPGVERLLKSLAGGAVEAPLTEEARAALRRASYGSQINR